MPSASSCLLHVFGFAEYPYQTESKRDKNGWSLFLVNMENSEGKSMRTSARGGHEAGGRPPLGRAPYPREPTIRRLALFFCRKKANIRKKIMAKVSIQSELRISGNIRNGERKESGNAETERDREIDPISEGLSPLPCHGGHGPEGKSFSHLGRRSRKKN